MAEVVHISQISQPKLTLFENQYKSTQKRKRFLSKERFEIPKKREIFVNSNFKFQNPKRAPS
jgi:hypothetical protein